MFFVDEVVNAELSFSDIEFYSQRQNRSLSIPWTVGEETRRSLAPPLPSRMAFVAKIPQSPMLRFAVGVATLGDEEVEASVRFRVYVDTGDSDERLFSIVLSRDQQNQWREGEVDLSSYAGSTSKIILETALVGANAAGSTGAPGESVVASLLPLWGNPVLSTTRPREEPLNLILVSIDCLRADHVGVYGYSRQVTPHIDRFAADGVVFETAIATSSWTVPTHMSMLTGLLPSSHGVHGKLHKLDPLAPYLPDLLAGAGYQVDGIVSWDYLSQVFGFERAFHHYRFLRQPGARGTIDAALAMARGARGHRQFLFVHLFDPHTPYLPPAELIERFGPRPKDISDLLDRVKDDQPPEDSSEVEQLINLYDAEIFYTDREIGRFLSELEKMGLYDNSLIVITADHGEAFYEHGHWEHSESLYDEIIRVPLIVKWPKGDPGGSVDHPVSQTDIFATILAAAGLAEIPTEAIDLGLYGNRPTGSLVERVLISEFALKLDDRNLTKMVSFRSPVAKYVAAIEAHDWDADEEQRLREELYDLIEDPQELRNLIELGHGVDDYRRMLSAHLAKERRLQAGRDSKPVVVDEETMERLRSLGYIH